MELHKKHLRPIGIKFFFCCCLYSTIMAYDLVNRQDGLWNGPYHLAGDWELSLGRWLIRYWDRFQMGIHINPWTALITLLLFILGTEVLVDILGFACGSWQDYLASMLFLSNMIICISVSYPYTSGVYGLAFFLGMICAKCVICSMEKKVLYLLAQCALPW